MKAFHFIVAFLLGISFTAVKGGSSGGQRALSAWAEQEADRIMAVADEAVKERLAQLDQSIVDYRYDASVRYTIGLYVERWRSGSSRILGRAAGCFPYFTDALAEAGMPEALKYISITESALRPFAVSHAGAAGYWQLMPGTARELGLQVDEVVDERLDVRLGTAAGLRYLQLQHERFGDWALALAAYNSGPGRVNQAMRRSKSKDYWKLRKFLPSETSGYVPGFIAATYLATFFREHELEVLALPLDVQLTETIRVYRELSLHRVAMLTGLRPAVVVELNPSYLAGYLPAHHEGRWLRLPSRVVPAMIAYLNTWHERGEEPAIPWRSPLLKDTETETDRYYTTYQTYPSSVDTTYRQLAAAVGAHPDQLLLWNGYGSQDSVSSSQVWIYHQVKEAMAFGPPDRLPTAALDVLPCHLPTALGSSAEATPLTMQPPQLVAPAATMACPSEKGGQKFKRIVKAAWNWIKA